MLLFHNEHMLNISHLVTLHYISCYLLCLYWQAAVQQPSKVCPAKDEAETVSGPSEAVDGSQRYHLRHFT